MIFAIDALPIGLAGGKDYAEMIVKYLSQVGAEHEYRVFVARGKEGNFPQSAPNVKIIPVNIRSLLQRLLWQQMVLPFLLRDVDILYTLGGIDILAAPCKTVIKIENMAPYHRDTASDPPWKGRIRLILLNLATRLSARTANGVLTMSQTAAQELVQQIGFPAHKVKGIIHSAEIENLQTRPVSLEDYGLQEDGYILVVSHLDRYKNIRELVYAYHLVTKDNPDLPPLVIAGRPRDKEYAESIQALIQEHSLTKVRLVGPIPRGSLYWFYSSCLFFVFTSTVETCPRILIEAIKCGAAIACSNKSAMPEICQDAALYFDPDEPAEIAAQMRRLINSPDLRRELRQKSREQARRFSWERTARETLNFFSRILDETE